MTITEICRQADAKRLFSLVDLRVLGKNRYTFRTAFGTLLQTFFGINLKKIFVNPATDSEQPTEKHN